MENTDAVESFNSGAVKRSGSGSPFRCPLPPKKRYSLTGLTEDDLMLASALLFLRSAPCSVPRMEEPETKMQTLVAEEESERNTSTTIESLPVELMINIFSKLGNSDLKKARRVCHSWNNLITARPLVKKLSYTVRRAPDSLKLLNSSTFPWENIQIKNCTTPKYPTWNFPAFLNTTLNSLTISECTFNWSWLEGIVQRFESLKTLTVRKCILKLDKNGERKRIGGGLAEIAQSNGCVTDVAPSQRLTIKLEMDSYAATNRFLEHRINPSSPLCRAALEIIIPEVNANKILEDMGHFL